MAQDDVMAGDDAGSQDEARTQVVRYARQVERPDVAVIATDVAGTVVYWSDGARALYGWGADEVIGRNIVTVTPADMSREEAERVMAVLSRGEPWAGEFLVRTRTGQRFLAAVTDIPVQDDAGRLTGIVGISRRRAYLGEVGPL